MMINSSIKPYICNILVKTKREIHVHVCIPNLHTKHGAISYGRPHGPTGLVGTT